MRDEFNAAVRDVLAKRAGMRCSNPNCRRSTSGPRKDSKKALNIGVAAHITAAAKGGPRYEPQMNAETRRSEANGIWLCQTCAKVVDNDPVRYDADLLHRWRRLSEEAALLDLETRTCEKDRGRSDDVELIKFYAQCLDRPAFQDHFRQEGSMEAFDRAIEDTITAINSGCLRSRDGGVLTRSKGKAFLERADWRQRMDLIVDLLRAIRGRYDDARRTGAIHIHDRPDGDCFYCISDREVADWMDQTRNQILEVFAEVCREAGVEGPPPLRLRPRFW